MTLLTTPVRLCVASSLHGGRGVQRRYRPDSCLQGRLHQQGEATRRKMAQQPDWQRYGDQPGCDSQRVRKNRGNEGSVSVLLLCCSASKDGACLALSSNRFPVRSHPRLRHAAHGDSIPDAPTVSTAAHVPHPTCRMSASSSALHQKK